MLTPLTLGLAFCAGIFGTVIGGTPAFILACGVTVLSQVLGFAGFDTAMLDLYGTNLFFLPAVCFTGSVAATAYAAVRKYDVKGYDTWRSMAVFNDPVVLLVGGLFGVIGYTVFRLAVDLGIPCDQGALSVFSVAVLVRLLWHTERMKESNTTRILSAVRPHMWLFHIMMAGCLAFGAGFFAEKTGIWNIGFGMSGLSLLFCPVEPNMPATHHVTLVAGYAMQMTHNLVIAVIFGIIAELLGYWFTVAYNNRCSTHVDPPAFAIILCSLVLFTVF